MYMYIYELKLLTCSFVPGFCFTSGGVCCSYGVYHNVLLLWQKCRQLGKSSVFILELVAMQNVVHLSVVKEDFHVCITVMIIPYSTYMYVTIKKA